MDRHAYATHRDLLDQVATSTLERDEVRRILGAELQRKLTEADLDARIAERDATTANDPAMPDGSPRRCGPCARGARQCATPQACELDAAPPRLPCGVRRHAALPLERLAAIGALLVSAAIVALGGAWLVMLLQRGLQ